MGVVEEGRRSEVRRKQRPTPNAQRPMFQWRERRQAERPPYNGYRA